MSDTNNNTSSEQWTAILEPRKKFMQFNLKEMWDYRDLYRIYVRRNIVTVYKTRQPFIKQKGTKVHAGEILTTFRNGTDSYFEFELWKDGVAVNPLTYISF